MSIANKYPYICLKSMLEKKKLLRLYIEVLAISIIKFMCNYKSFYPLSPLSLLDDFEVCVLVKVDQPNLNESFESPMVLVS